MRSAGICDHATETDDGVVIDKVQTAIDDKISLPFHHRCEEFNGKCEGYDASIPVSIVVGMHPDSATELIIDAALKDGLSFAVVPCCVFPLQFPHRKNMSGGDVVSYEEFVDYLQAKHVSICRTSLPFFGRNIVLFRSA